MSERTGIVRTPETNPPGVVNPPTPVEAHGSGSKSGGVMPYAWVNGNPTPRLHAFGKVMSPGRIVALCRVQVRHERGKFDPDDPQSCEDCAAYVRRGLTFDEASREVSKKVAQMLEGILAPHAEHPWHEVGRCVYCGPCGTRLYQGTVPDDHPRWTPQRRERPRAKSAVERWRDER